MKILVMGASGLLGRAIVKELRKYNFYSIVATGFTRSGKEYHKLDIRNYDHIKKFLYLERPKVIIYSIAERNPTFCEANPQIAKVLNVEGIKCVAEIAKNMGAWVIYISTDYVFDGENSPYKPNDVTNPLNEYGKSKLAGEQALWELIEDACVIRLPILYGEIEYLNESAVTSIAKFISNNRKDEILIDDWAIRYPTHTEGVAKFCRYLIQEKSLSPNLKGTFHWSDTEPYTKYSIALIMAELLGIKSDCLVPIRKKNLHDVRPFNCHLESSVLEKPGINSRRSFKKNIQDVLHNYWKTSSQAKDDKYVYNQA